MKKLCTWQKRRVEDSKLVVSNGKSNNTFDLHKEHPWCFDAFDCLVLICEVLQTVFWGWALFVLARWSSGGGKLSWMVNEVIKAYNINLWSRLAMQKLNCCQISIVSKFPQRSSHKKETYSEHKSIFMTKRHSVKKSSEAKGVNFP